MIKDFLSLEVNDRAFLQFDNKIISRKEFVEYVNQTASLLNRTDNEFIYLDIEHPFFFYVGLFACWFLDKKVVLPTKLSLEFYNVPQYAKYIFTVKGEKFSLFENENFNISLKISQEKGDTIVFSSGSTGVPKGILHEKENFFLNAQATLNILQIEQYNTSITFLKPYLVSSLSHMIVHWYAKSQLIFEDFSHLHLIHKYKNITSALNIVGSPIHIISSIKYLVDFSFNPNYFFSSGDIISDIHIRNILNHFPKTIFFKVYGLAEVAGRLFIKKIDNTTQCYDIGKYLDITKIKYENDEVIVSSDILFSGYIKENVFFSSNKVFSTGDLVATICKDKKVLQGRKNDEVKIAGHKVMTKYLENIILNLCKEKLEIDFVVIVPLPHKLFGHILALIISSQKEIGKQEIVHLLRLELQTYQIPHQFYVIELEDIPFTQTMKVDRQQLNTMIQTNKLRQLI